MTWIKKWWQFHSFTVTYCMSYGMLKNRYDKFEYDNFEDAKKRLDYLNSLSAEDVLKEGFEFVPNYLGIEHVSGPNPINRFRNYLKKTFGF